MNEVYSSVRDEIRSIILFKSGSPLSRWSEEKNTIDLPDSYTKTIFTKIERRFNELFDNHTIIPLSDEPEDTGDYYSEIVASLIFKFRRMKTQDAILLATAISVKADYFVTFDGRLIKDLKEEISSTYKLLLIRPAGAFRILNKKKR